MVNDSVRGDQAVLGQVLVVHHDPDTRSLLANHLQPGGYAVSTVADVESALAELAPHMADVLIIDLALVQPSEGEPFATLLAQYPTLRLVMIGDDCSLEEAVGAMKQGAMDFIYEPHAYLQRPFEAERLQAIVADVLHRPLPSPQGPMDYDDLIERARQWAEHKDFDRAQTLIREAIKQAPNRPEGLTLLGQITEYLGSHNEALKLYRAAIGLDPTYKQAQQNLDRAAMHPHSRPSFTP